MLVMLMIQLDRLLMLLLLVQNKLCAGKLMITVLDAFNFFLKDASCVIIYPTGLLAI